MKILATADLHGDLPEIDPCDILIIGGDICPITDHDITFQARWVEDNFGAWILELPAKHIVLVAGNHDFVFEHYPGLLDDINHLVYLEDSAVTLSGIKIYGTPWVPRLRRWAFYKTDRDLKVAFNKIPDDLDILVSHGPPWGYGDFTVPMFGSEHAGCYQLGSAVKQKTPKTIVCGHIHEAYGHYEIPYIKNGLYNVAYKDENYDPRENSTIEIPYV